MIAERHGALTVSGRRLALHEWGEPNGMPLVHWHGLGTRAGLHLNEVAPILAGEHRFRVITPDAPGFGGSEPSPDMRPAALADLIAALLDALGLGRVALSGWSWGASIGCWLVARHPLRLRAAVLLDAGYADPQADDDASLEQTRRLWEEESAADRAALVERLRARGGRWSDAIEAAFLAGWHEHDGRLELVPAPETFARAFAGLQQDPPTSAWPAMATSRVPVLLVAAATADDGDVARFRAAVPQTSVERLADAGHDVCRDQPVRVAELVGGWLRRLEPAP